MRLSVPPLRRESTVGPGLRIDMVKYLVCVEGAIGAGKSTLLKNIQEKNLPGIKVLSEPVDEWRACKVNNDGKNLLECMYDGTISSSLFQLTVLQSRFGPLMKALCDPDVKIVISERGPWSEKHVFSRTNLNDIEFACYNYAHSALTRDILPICGDVNVLFLHLHIRIESVLERIKKRGRVEESGITKKYLTRLEAAHVDMKTATATADQLGSKSVVHVKHVDVYADQGEAELAAVSLDTILRMCDA